MAISIIMPITEKPASCHDVPVFNTVTYAVVIDIAMLITVLIIYRQTISFGPIFIFFARHILVAAVYPA